MEQVRTNRGKEKMLAKVMVKNAIRCKHCGDIIVSTYRHDSVCNKNVKNVSHYLFIVIQCVCWRYCYAEYQ